MQTDSNPIQPSSKTLYQREWARRQPSLKTYVVDGHLPINQQELTAIFSRVTIDPAVTFNGSPCWLWMGHLNHGGYARMYYRGKQHNAHRILFQMFVGMIDGDDQGDHLCRVRNCVNPVHVDNVSGRVNTLRGEAASAKNARKTHCPQGHPYTPENTRYKRNGRNRICMTCQRAQDKIRWHHLHPSAPYRATRCTAKPIRF